jgi:hypothetical protein
VLARIFRMFLSKGKRSPKIQEFYMP